MNKKTEYRCMHTAHPRYTVLKEAFSPVQTDKTGGVDAKDSEKSVQDS